MASKNLDLYEDLSAAGLTGDLHERMQIIRPGISRNTIRLALVEGGTTPLRRRILQEANTVWEEHRASDTDNAPAYILPNHLQPVAAM